MDVEYLGIVETLDAFRNRTLSPVEYLDHVLGRIERFNGKVNAFFFVDAEGARAAAKRSEARWAKGAPMGTLDGLPFSVKDHVLTKGMPSPWGTTAVDLKGPWPVDAPAVARLKEDGAILVGKTTQPELASLCSGLSGLYGTGRNPWDLSKTPGGSSGGAAAALASDMGPLAWGSDGGGSIRNPASYSGVVGYKPSFGRIPLAPPMGQGPTYGPMTRRASDLPAIMNVVTRPDWSDVLSLPYDGKDYAKAAGASLKGKRIAMSEWFGFGTPTAPSVSAVFRDAARCFTDLGATVETVEPFFDYDPYDRLAPMVFAGLTGMAAGITGGKIDALLPELRAVIAKAADITLPEFFGGKMEETQIQLRIAAALKDFDYLITPTMPTTAYDAELPWPADSQANRYGYHFGHNPFTWLFNVTLQPAVSLPCGLSEGMPVGLQIVAPRGDDFGCVAAAIAFEKALGIKDFLPPLKA
ncbi:MAG: amidase family protein [Rhizomicrobium sp.]